MSEIKVFYNAFSDEEIQKVMDYWDSSKIGHHFTENYWDTKSKEITEIRSPIRLVDIIGLPLNFYPLITFKFIRLFGAPLEGPHFITKYPTGGFHAEHNDTGISNGIRRTQVITVQLTDPSEYEGGSLIINGITAPKDKGCIIMYDGNDPHEVTPVTSGVRFSLTECAGVRQ